MFVKRGRFKLPHDYVDMVKRLVSERVRKYSMYVIHKRTKSEIYTDGAWCESIYNFIEDLTSRYLDPDASDKVPMEYKKKMHDLSFENQTQMAQLQQLRGEYDILDKKLHSAMIESNEYKNNCVKLSMNINSLLGDVERQRVLLEELRGRRKSCFC
jgi:hypothetical protein